MEILLENDILLGKETQFYLIGNMSFKKVTHRRIASFRCSPIARNLQPMAWSLTIVTSASATIFWFSVGSLIDILSLCPTLNWWSVPLSISRNKPPKLIFLALAVPWTPPSVTRQTSSTRLSFLRRTYCLSSSHRGGVYPRRLWFGCWLLGNISGRNIR